MSSNNASYKIRPPVASDSQRIHTLIAQTHGPGRFARSAYRVRSSFGHEILSRVAETPSDGLCAVVQVFEIHAPPIPDFWLLGPLAVAPEHQKKGHGAALIQATVKEAQACGCASILLVGDLAYYGTHGFRVVDGTSPWSAVRDLLRPVSSHRLLVRDIA